MFNVIDTNEISQEILKILSDKKVPLKELDSILEKVKEKAPDYAIIH